MGVEKLKQLACLVMLLAGLACGCAQIERRVAVRETTSVDPMTVTPTGSSFAGWQPTGAGTDEEVQSRFQRPVVVSFEAKASATLESFENLALASNPTLVEHRARVNAAEGNRLQVGLKPNPVVGLSVQEIGNDDSAGQYGAYVRQNFVTANKLTLNQNAAEWQVKRAEHELAAQRLRVLTDVRRAFYSTRVAQERLKVAEELHGIARQAVLKAKELIKNQEPRTVLTQAEIEAELAALLVENTRTQQISRWRRLTTVAGQPGLPVQDVSGELVADVARLVWEEALERIHRESPELAAAAAEVERADWALRRAHVQGTPNVTVQAGAFYDDASRDPFATVQVSLPLPVYDRNQGGIAEADSNAIAARQRVERVQLRLKQRLATVYQQYEQARQQASRYGGVILKKAKQNLDLNRQSYESGESSYLAVLTAQRSYAQARLAWLDALEQLWSATVEIQGLLLSDSLE